MVKIGRNERCPCGSGKKYKQCCGRTAHLAPTQPPVGAETIRTAMDGIAFIQRKAAARKASCRELGVLFFFSSAAGDAWVMEMSGGDCVQVASGGEPLEPPIEENPETIEVDWSHMYVIRDRQVELTAYKDREVMILEGAPSSKLNSAMRRMRKRFTREQLDQVHLAVPE